MKTNEKDIDHSKKNFVEALGLEDSEYRWIEELVKNSFKTTTTISGAIDHAIEELRHKEFGKTNSHPSSYEYKIALSGLVVGMIVSQQQMMQHAIPMPVGARDLERFFIYLMEMTQKQRDVDNN